MLFRVTITIKDHATNAWAETLARAYERSEPEADIHIIVREDLLCCVASFDSEQHNPYRAGELGRSWFTEAAEVAGLPDDVSVASWDVLAVAPEAYSK